MSDWETLLSFPPEGWKEQARKTKALWRRGWEVQDPEVLLHILLIHLAQGYSLKETAVNFGHLPKQDPRSAKAWLYGKLLVALLAESIVESVYSFSPWGYIKIEGKNTRPASLRG